MKTIILAFVCLATLSVVVADSVQFHFEDTLPPLCSANRKYTGAITAFNKASASPSDPEDLLSLLDSNFKFFYNGQQRADSAEEYWSIILAGSKIFITSDLVYGDFFVNGKSAVQTGTRTVTLRGSNGLPTPSNAIITSSQLFSFNDKGLITAFHQIEDASQLTFLGISS
jgi:hypothetical protein